MVSEDQDQVVEAPKPEVAAAPKGEGPAPKKKTGMIIVLVIAAVLLVGMAVATKKFLFSTGPDQVVRAYLAAQAAEDLPSMRKLLAKSSAALLPPDDGKTPKAKAPKAEKLPEMEIGKATVKGDKATVPVKVKQETPGGFGGDQAITVVLVKEDGQWKVDILGTLQESYKSQMQGMGGQPGMGGAPEGAVPEGTPPAGTPPSEMAPAPGGPPPASAGAPPTEAPPAPAPAPAKPKKP